MIQTRKLYDEDDGSVQSPSFYSPFIASLVTSYARQALTRHMEKCDGHLAYLDTGIFFELLFTKLKRILLQTVLFLKLIQKLKANILRKTQMELSAT